MTKRSKRRHTSAPVYRARDRWEQYRIISKLSERRCLARLLHFGEALVQEQTKKTHEDRPDNLNHNANSMLGCDGLLLCSAPYKLY